MATTKNKKLCPSPWVDAAIQAGGNLLSSGIQALTQPSLKKQRRSKQKYDAWYQQNVTEKNMALQNQYQIDAENRQHAYDDPAAQAARLKAAGINPMALDGGAGAGIQGSVSSAPSPSGGGSFSPTPMAVRPDFSGIGNLIRESRLAESQIDLQKSQIAKNLSDAKFTDKQIERMVYGKDNGEWQAQVKQSKLKAANDEQQNAMMEINLLIANATAEDDIALRSLSLTEARARIDKLREDKKLAEKNGALFAAKVKEIDELLEPRKDNIEAHTRLASMTESEIETKILSALRDLDLKDLDIARTAREVYRAYRNLPATNDTNLLNTGGWLANSFICAVTRNLTSEEDAQRFFRRRGEVEKKLRKKFGLDE